MDKIITIKEQVYQIIKKRIANGTYSHGQRLQENDLAADFKVSRSPIREALKQLVFEGILEEVPNKGVSLRKFSEKEIADTYDLRVLFECYAIDLLAENPEFFPRERLTNVRRAILELDDRAIDYVVSSDVNPHDVILEATGNDFLIDIYRRASFRTMSYHIVLFAGDNYKLNNRQHLDIVDALLEKDFREAKEALTSHLLTSKEIICSAIKDGAV